MLRTAAELFRAQGFHATGLNQVLAEGGAPKGSLYFHFPGGKEQLAVEAVAYGGAVLREAIEVLLADAPDAVSGVDGLVDALSGEMVRSGFRLGCPVGVIAQDTVDIDAIRSACAAAFESWRAAIEDFLVGQGVSRKVAPGLATTVLAAIEGAQLLARSQQDVAPLRSVGESLRGLVRTHLPKES